jgi:hypothetical protein
MTAKPPSRGTPSIPCLRASVFPRLASDTDWTVDNVRAKGDSLPRSERGVLGGAAQPPPDSMWTGRA